MEVLQDLVDTVGVEIPESDKALFQLIGEQGAARLDAANEATTRLAIARKMEASGKDAQAIKLATGWERGADAKWRYEAPDCDWKGIYPFLDENLWWTRAALDWTLLYHIREMLSPGCLSRMERNMKKDFNQEFIVSPSAHIARGGGWR